MLSLSRPPLLGVGSPAPCTMFPGRGWCGRGDPSPAPQRALLRISVARCGDGGRASLGGVPRAVVMSVWCQAITLPPLPVVWAGSRGPLPTCCARACAGMGTRYRPFGVRALGGVLRAVGVARGCRGGAPVTVVRGVWWQVLSLSGLPILRAGSRAPLPMLAGQGGVGVRTKHRPHSVRSCEPA